MSGEKRLFGVMKTDGFCLSEQNAFAISLSATGSLQAEPNKKEKRKKKEIVQGKDLHLQKPLTILNSQ